MFRKLAIGMTDKCSAECEMCCFGCSPNGSRTLSSDLMKDVIRQASEVEEIRAVGFSGGEPFMVYDQLLDCCHYTQSLGLQVTVNTNGFWGRNEKRAVEMLEALKAAGVTALSFSADRYHQKFVPIEDLRTAMRLTHAVGLEQDVTIMETAHSDDIVRMTEALRPEIYCATVINHPMLPVGKALESVEEGNFLRFFDSKDAICTFDGMFQLNFDGHYYMCCSQYCREIPRLNLGDAREVRFRDLKKKITSDDYLYVMLRKGFGWYVVRARELGYDIPERVCTSCHCCYMIMGNQKLLDEMRECVAEEAGRLRVQHLLGT